MLKNTDWVVGIVVFTGDDTKIRRNSRDPPFKRSSLEVSMNVGLNSLFIVMFVISILSALAGTLFEVFPFFFFFAQIISHFYSKESKVLVFRSHSKYSNRSFCSIFNIICILYHFIFLHDSYFFICEY